MLLQQTKEPLYWYYGLVEPLPTPIPSKLLLLLLFYICIIIKHGMYGELSTILGWSFSHRCRIIDQSVLPPILAIFLCSFDKLANFLGYLLSFFWVFFFCSNLGLVNNCIFPGLPSSSCQKGRSVWLSAGLSSGHPHTFNCASHGPSRNHSSPVRPLSLIVEHLASLNGLLDGLDEEEAFTG